MTIAAATNLSVGFGNGSLNQFPFTFSLPAGSTGSEIQVYIVDNLGNVTNLTSNYSVNIPGSYIGYPNVGGIAPLGVGVTLLPTNWMIVMLRVEPLTQLVSLTNNGVFDATSIMGAFDYLTMLCQQLQEQINRCYKVPPGTLPAAISVTPVAQLPSPSGTYAYLKSLALASPTVPFTGYASDIGASGEYTLVFYTGTPTIGDQGFLIK